VGGLPQLRLAGIKACPRAVPKYLKPPIQSFTAKDAHRKTLSALSTLFFPILSNQSGFCSANDLACDRPYESSNRNSGHLSRSDLGIKAMLRSPRNPANQLLYLSVHVLENVALLRGQEVKTLSAQMESSTC